MRKRTRCLSHAARTRESLSTTRLAPTPQREPHVVAPAGCTFSGLNQPHAAQLSETACPTAARRMMSASVVLTPPAPFTSQMHGRQLAEPTAVLSATSASLAETEPSPFPSAHVASSAYIW